MRASTMRRRSPAVTTPLSTTPDCLGTSARWRRWNAWADSSPAAHCNTTAGPAHAAPAILLFPAPPLSDIEMSRTLPSPDSREMRRTVLNAISLVDRLALTSESTNLPCHRQRTRSLKEVLRRLTLTARYDLRRSAPVDAEELLNFGR